MLAIKLSGKTLPLPAWVSALSDVGISPEAEQRAGLAAVPLTPARFPCSVTLWTRVRGEQQHCLNPKRQNTVRLLKWYRVWKEKGR